jgi:hypothetical protein
MIDTYIQIMCADCGCAPSECMANNSGKEYPNCTWNEYAVAGIQ